MEFILHPEAVKSFNEEAERLYNELNYSPICYSKIEQKSFRPDFFISSVLTEKDIVGDVRTSTTDWTGAEIAVFFYHEGEKIGILGENYRKLMKLSEGMQRVPQLYQFVSVPFLKGSIFNWMKDKYINKNPCSMVEYIIQVCKKDVNESEIWVPLAHTYIQSEIKIGRITLKTITVDLLNKWIDRWEMNANTKEKAKKDLMEKYQEKLQGLAAATISLCAEPERANEIAMEEADKAASILRIFSPGVFHPRIISCCTLLGREHIETNNFFRVKKRTPLQAAGHVRAVCN